MSTPSAKTPLLGMSFGLLSPGARFTLEPGAADAYTATSHVQPADNSRFGAQANVVAPSGAARELGLPSHTIVFPVVSSEHLSRLRPGSDLVHALSSDGLTLMSTCAGSGGRSTLTVSWSDLEVARDHYAIAMLLNEERLLEVLDSSKTLTNTRLQSRKVGPFVVSVDAGPPVWLWPRIWIPGVGGRRHLGGGWLYRAFSIALAGR